MSFSQVAPRAPSDAALFQLDEEFRYLQRKRNTDLAETRSKVSPPFDELDEEETNSPRFRFTQNLRFYAELTKFRVTPIHVILHVFKVILDDFSGPNIDNFCTLLEGCGRFLLRNEATSERMRQVIDIYKRKKASMHLDQRQLTMLDNAYYQVRTLRNRHLRPQLAQGLTYLPSAILLSDLRLPRKSARRCSFTFGISSTTFLRATRATKYSSSCASSTGKILLYVYLPSSSGSPLLKSSSIPV